jgi:bla regulator protein blaR1
MATLLLIRVSLLLGITLAGARLLRRGSASTRHAIWTAAFVALLTLPALPHVVPGVDVPVPDRWRPASPVATSGGGPGPVSIPWRIVRGATDADLPPSPSKTSSESSPASAPSLVSSWLQGLPPGRSLFGVVIALWIAGSVAALAALALSLWRVRALERTACDLADGEWRTAADTLAARIGVAPPRLRVSHGIQTPMAGGLTSPAIYLPASAPGWRPERRDIVLAHELAHLARRDPLRHVVARVAVALYWFHPLAWLAAADASAAREHACDETVLALGTRPSAYAQVLLDFAEAQSSPLRSIAALPIVERSLLEKRLMAILSHDSRVSSRRHPLVAAAAVVVIAAGVAAARPAARAAMAPPEATAAVSAVPPAAATPQSLSDLACNPRSWRSFSGSTSSSRDGVVYDMIGTSGGDRIVLRTFDDLEVCMVGEGLGGDDRSVRPSEWPDRAARSVIESRAGSRTERLELTREGGGQRVRWLINGVQRPFDAAAQQWRERMLAVLDTNWEISSIRGEVSTLRGEISTLRGQESTLRGEIATLRGEVSSKRGEISTVHGEESSLRGEISSIQGHVSSLRGEISSAQGQISSLMASRYDAGDAERARIARRIREEEAEIARLEDAIRDYRASDKIAEVERRIANLAVQKKVEAIEGEIKALHVDAKIAEIENAIRALDVEGKSAAIERQIQRVNADSRVRDSQARLDQELKELRAALARIR